LRNVIAIVVLATVAPSTACRHACARHPSFARDASDCGDAGHRDEQGLLTEQGALCFAIAHRELWLGNRACELSASRYGAEAWAVSTCGVPQPFVQIDARDGRLLVAGTVSHSGVDCPE